MRSPPGPLIAAVAVAVVVLVGVAGVLVLPGRPRLDPPLASVPATQASTTVRATQESGTTAVPATISTFPVSITTSAVARPEGWRPLAASLLSPRAGHTVVWTGSEALIWGSADPQGECGQANDGAGYEPVSDSWRPLAASPKEGGSLLSVVWTGREMILWGGLYGFAYCLPGEPAQSAAHDPQTDEWRALPSPPEGGNVLSAVWTGEEMIVWGNYVDEGYGVPPYTAQGAAYDPAADRWRLTADLPLPDRIGYSAVWTGSEMIIWGGSSFRHPAHEQLVTDHPREVAAYDPASDAWRVRAAAPLPGRSWHASVWTGSELIVWGGENESGYLGDGAAYDPLTDTWRPISAAPLSGRHSSTAVWTGRSMIVWGGSNESGYLNDGAAYDPLTDTWHQLPTAPLEGRRGHSAVWTGDEMIIWGGNSLGASVPQFTYFDDGAAYTPPAG